LCGSHSNATAQSVEDEAIMVLRSILKRRPLSCITVVLVAILIAQALLKRGSDWQNVFVRAGQQWWTGLDIYAAGSSYLYPPFQAMIAAPFAALPEWLSRLGWAATSSIGMIVMVGAAWRLAGGRPLRSMPFSERSEWLAFAVGLLCSLTYILNAFAHQQTDVMIGALLMGGAWNLAAGRDAAGGALIGLAAAFKATPLLWAPYLLWRRRWIAALLVGVVALAVNLLPDLVATPAGGPRTLQWLTQYVLPTQQLGVALGNWGSALEYNQALGGTVQRLVNTRLELSYPNPTITLRPVVAAQTLKLIVYAVFIVLIAVSVAAAMRARRVATDAGALPQPMAFEFSMVLALMLLMSPMSGRAHFGILVLPAFCLARTAFATRDRILGLILGIAAVLTLAANKDLVGSFTYGALLWLGTTTVCTFTLWAGCVYVLCCSPRKQSVPLSGR
jgi:hypothetical protein